MPEKKQKKNIKKNPKIPNTNSTEVKYTYKTHAVEQKVKIIVQNIFKVNETAVQLHT